MKYFCKGCYKSVKEARDSEPIDLNLMLLTQCNQSCSYCFNHCSPKNHEFISDEVLDTLAKKIVEYKKPVGLTLLGGEPTLHPKLKEMVDKFSPIPNISNIEIHTNGRKSLKSIIKKGVIVVFSIHPEYSKHIDTVIKHIQEVQESVETRVKILYHPFFKNEIHFLEKKLTENNISFWYVPVCDFREREQDYEYATATFNVNGKILPLKYIMDNKLNKFKNWMCLSHSIRVDTDGSVIALCINKKENILDKNYKLGKQLICCKSESCVNDCALDALKIKVGE